MSDDTDWDTLFSLVEDVGKIVKNNQDEIQSFINKHNELSITDNDQLTNVTKTEDEIIIDLEMKDAAGIQDFSFKYNDSKNKLKVVSNGETTAIILPDDADVENAEANFNNGVLSLTIPRTSEEIEVDVVDERDNDEGGEE